MNSLALFDFDGTITTKDTFSQFLIYLMSPPRLIFESMILGPTYVAYLFNLISNNSAKGMALKRVLKGYSEEQLLSLGLDFYENRCRDLIRPKAINRIKWHKDRGDDVVLVSASVGFWLLPFANEYDLDLICTRVKCEQGICLGQLDGLNCFGPEKVRRVEEKYDFSKYEIVYAYGDTRGDKEMLEAAKLGFFKPFRGTGSDIPMKSWEAR